MLSALLLFAGAYAQTMDVTSPTHHGRGTIVFDAATTVYAATPVAPTVTVSATESRCLSAAVVEEATAAGYKTVTGAVLAACDAAACDVTDANALNATGQHYVASAALTLSLPTTEVGGLALADCLNGSAAQIYGYLLYAVQYAYTIEKHDDWDSVDTDDDIHFKGLKKSAGWMCFLSHSKSFDTDPVCDVVGTTTELESDARVTDGDAVRCTAAADEHGRVKLKVKSTAQDHLRVRHCLYAGDSTSPVKEHHFDMGTAGAWFWAFMIFAVLTVLLFILFVVSWWNRRRGHTATGPVGKVLAFASLKSASRPNGMPVVFACIIAVGAILTAVFAYQHWGSGGGEFTGTAIGGGVIVLALIVMLVMGGGGGETLPQTKGSYNRVRANSYMRSERVLSVQQ